MTLQKQPININFSKGVETKTDPFQIPIGNFAALSNSVFTKGGLLQKRNGYPQLPSLPDATSTYATTFNGDLTAIGNKLEAYSIPTEKWVNKGSIQPVTLSVLPLVRNNLNQTQADSATASNGLVCTVYTETDGSTNSYKYVVADSLTGQNIVLPTEITGADATLGTPRVFIAGSRFLIVYTNKVSTTYHLKFISISTNDPTVVTAPVDISTSYTPAASVAFDGAVLNSTLYLAWNGASSSGLKMAFIAPNLSVSSTVIEDSSHQSTIVAVAADQQNQVIWAAYYDDNTNNGYTLATDPHLAKLPSFPAQIISSLDIANLSISAASGVMTAFYENIHQDNGVDANFISSIAVDQATATPGSPSDVVRSVGLASKAFIVDGMIYFMSAYQSTYQPTYFLMDSSGQVIAKLAYENGGGYLGAGLPNITVTGQTVLIPYLFKDLIQAVNKNTNVPSGNQVDGIYSQTGINLASFTIGTSDITAAEIGNNLNISGGFLWAYDGFQPTEQNFFLYPEPVQVSTDTSGGDITAQEYFYQATYEWTDNQGNAFRSAPSIPVSVTTTGSTSTNTLIIPTLRLTYKLLNPVKLVLYRWSVAQQTYYQVTSIAVPTLNDTSVDSITVTDVLADADILGNNILYTTGGVLENIGPPSFRSVFTFDDRLLGIPSESPNNLWISKQVLEATPVEMSDLLTTFVAPGLGAQGPTGNLTCGSSMDDKAILFKSHALYYINGTGPDNTGANNQYSQPIFINSTVGCSNPVSIVLIPTGLMFEFSSESGNQIWLLGRDLSTNYIGSPVEEITKNATITSAVNIPGTNQVKFTLSSGIAITYDYYYGQWDTDANVSAVSSTLFEGSHTYIRSSGAIFQQSPDTYLDGTTPVLLSLTTGWINLAGIRGYQRAYSLYLLGQYFSPFRIICSIAYDYNSAPIHTAIISPTNFSPAYGSPEANGQSTTFGATGPYGGGSNILNWRVFLKKQRCSSLQITLQEIYDPSFGVAAGKGFTLSGLSVVCAIRSGIKTIGAQHSVGAK